ncbi:MAG: hypothetical protein FD133_94 [Erysipelotrichaceae bacterium]|nr:MAG: hypothetical protein FD179_214 [Erysipelotrichaceae bacterium]TXT19975.1 MAG: hypothetical protein FD133_94 [Erysipelotrichaceae bacterium]
MGSHSIVVHIQIIDHLDREPTQSYECSALYHDQPLSLSYLEKDQTTKVNLILNETEWILHRDAQWQTHIIFQLNGSGTFRVISDQGEMRGQVKILKHHIDAHQLSITYKLIMEDSVITYQTLTYTMKGAQA